MTIVLFFLVCDKEAFDKNGRKKTGNRFLISCLDVPSYTAAIIQFLVGYNSTNLNLSICFSALRRPFLQ